MLLKVAVGPGCGWVDQYAAEASERALGGVARCSDLCQSCSDDGVEEGCKLGIESK